MKLRTITWSRRSLISKLPAPSSSMCQPNKSKMSKQTLAPIVDRQQTKQTHAQQEEQTTKPLEQTTATDTTQPNHDLAKPKELDTTVTNAANALQDVKKRAKTGTGRPKRDHDTEDETSTIGSCPSTNSLASHGKLSSTSYGRWTREEHEGFLEGLKLHGREWKKVSEMIPTRTSAQIRSHAQKYFAKMAKEGLSSQGTSSDGSSGVAGVEYTSATFVKKIEMILKDPGNVEKEVEAKLNQLHNLHQKLLRRLEAKRAAAKERKERQAENNAARSLTATSDMQTLLDEAEAEMRVTKKLKLDNPNHRQHAGESRHVGPATAALARRLEEEANKSSPEHSSSDTSNCLQQMFASSKKASVSCNDLNEVCNGTSVMSKESANSLHSGVHASSAVITCGRDNSSYMSNEMIALEVLGGGGLSQSCSDLTAHAMAHQQHQGPVPQPQDSVNLKRKVV
uniref:HTH myb-type domain-containing protein n=1 Tax=Leptocylindrus danicus TaxID=163516 RepID=A0A7S2K0K9_9STRA|mmetsp:Transcript_15409/g.22765  ORF Transcript_15409/g.22765 Transcript_15409/m.22765 type:complete len:453 (+) Transcript_15409:775-2133(+)